MYKKLILVLGWVATTLATFAITLLLHSQAITAKSSLAPLLTQKLDSSYSTIRFPLVYAALPTTTNQLTLKVHADDARPIMIDKYLRYYNSPLAGYGQIITQISDQYGLDPYLFVAIAQQESNLCKKIPQDSFNCWGWGIHSRGTLKFDSFEQAIPTVIKGLTEDYIGEGLIDPNTIMLKYTPLSNGSWASGVNQFLAELESGNY